MKQNLGLILINKKMKLEIEIKSIQKNLDKYHNYSFFKKIIYKREYHNNQSLLIIKEQALIFLSDYLKTVNKDKLDFYLSNNKIKIINQISDKIELERFLSNIDESKY